MILVLAVAVVTAIIVGGLTDSEGTGIAAGFIAGFAVMPFLLAY